MYTKIGFEIEHCTYLHELIGLIMQQIGLISIRKTNIENILKLTFEIHILFSSHSFHR